MQKCSLAEEGYAKNKGQSNDPGLDDACGFAPREFMGATAAPIRFTLVSTASVLSDWAECSQHCRACGEQGTSELLPPCSCPH